MAQDSQQEPQYSEIYTLGLEAGIKRDGTQFEARECSDGVWCRFQRGVPKKMGGYQQIFSTFNGIPRGMIMNSNNGVNYVFSGNKNGLDIFATGQSFGVGAGPFMAQMLAGYALFTVATKTTPTYLQLVIRWYFLSPLIQQSTLFKVQHTTLPVLKMLPLV